MLGRWHGRTFFLAWASDMVVPAPRTVSLSDFDPLMQIYWAPPVELPMADEDLDEEAVIHNLARA